MNSGEYRENLRHGGTLVINQRGWSIKYYFAGPDLRYDGEFITISSSNVPTFIIAFKNNYKKLQELKKTIPIGGNFDIIGECGMHIGLGSFYGVTIAKWYNHLSNGNIPVKNESDLTIVITDYEYCIKKAEEIKNLLFNN